MSTIILLFAIGILLLAAEVILPGGIAGVLGGILMLSGCVVAFTQLGAGSGFVAVLVALIVTGLVLYFEFRILPHTRFGKRAFLEAAITGVSAPATHDLSILIGKPAVALTTLAPSGYVQVDDQRVEAVCRSGHAEKGARLEVIGNESLRLIVTQKAHA